MNDHPNMSDSEQGLDPTRPPGWDGPPRPLDTWRICGRRIDDQCPCADEPYGPSQATALAAIKRLRGEVE